MRLKTVCLAALAAGKLLAAPPPPPHLVHRRDIPPLFGGYVDRQVTADKLRQYCSACHAIGDLKFIPSDNDDELWDTLFHQTPPDSKVIWAQLIIERLDWPTDVAPNVVTQPEWMPQGAKRLQMALDYSAGANARHIILDTLRADLP